MAHSWGEQSQNNADCEPYDDLADILNSKEDPPYFCRRTPGKQEFAYRFKEYNPNDKQKIYPAFTDRIITVSSDAYLKYNVSSNADNPEVIANCFGLAGYAYAYQNSTYNNTACIPISSSGWSATTYMYFGVRTPALDEDFSCGNRCKRIWAYRSNGPYAAKNSAAFFQCPVTVNEVSNTTSDQHQIPDAVARAAAASIALQGRWTGNVTDKVWVQYQFNPIK